MLDEDWDACVRMAQDAVGEGSHVVDLCVDYVGEDGVEDMDELASRFATAGDDPGDARLDRATGHRGRAAVDRRQGRSSTR